MSILNLEGAYENELVASGEFNLRATKTALLLPSGQRIVLPTDILLSAMESQVPVAGVAHDTPTPVPASERSAEEPRGSLAYAGDPGGEQVIPLVEERLVVGKREVETGRVRLQRKTEETVQTVSVPLTETRWEVEHIPMGHVVETQPEVRREGETMIFPLVEERLVVTRELWLREEVHVRKISSVVEKSADFALKRDVLSEERTGSA